jgi:hypothetical protein
MTSFVLCGGLSEMKNKYIEERWSKMLVVALQNSSKEVIIIITFTLTFKRTSCPRSILTASVSSLEV